MRQVAGAQLHHLLAPQSGEHAGQDDGPVAQPRGFLSGRGGQESAQLVGGQAARGGRALPGPADVLATRRVAAGQAHAPGEVVQAANGGQADGDRQRRRRAPAGAGDIGKGVDVGRAGGGGVSETGQETAQDAAVLLGGAGAAGALADLGQVGGDDALPAAAGRGGEVGRRGRDETNRHHPGWYH